ncbi:hypothetical protein [Streptosporangium sp. NPDC051022]|uniref:hypothetical protein n=1 Tax=Streptosporangium sp. NPDC051022 TaxID=3155752 RepID=UPI00343B632A
MQRLAIFDLDNTLVDLDEAFQVWAEEFAQKHGLGHNGVSWLVGLDRSGSPHREAFFTKAKEHFGLSSTADELWSQYRRRMPYLYPNREPRCCLTLPRFRCPTAPLAVWPT